MLQLSLIPSSHVPVATSDREVNKHSHPSAVLSTNFLTASKYVTCALSSESWVAVWTRAFVSAVFSVYTRNFSFLAWKEQNRRPSHHMLHNEIPPYKCMICVNREEIASYFLFSGSWPAVVGVHQERPGPRWCVASMGHGFSEGREPFWSPGDVCPLPEGPIGPKPAQPGPVTAAGDCQAPGDDCTTHSGGRKAPLKLLLTSPDVCWIVSVSSV